MVIYTINSSIRKAKEIRNSLKTRNLLLIKLYCLEIGIRRLMARVELEKSIEKTSEKVREKTIE